MFMKRFYIMAVICLVALLGLKPTLQAQSIWDGTADISWYDANQTSFDISTPEQLAGVAQLVNTGTSFNGKTLNLTADIWLNSTGDSTNNWTPIGGGSPTSESPSTGNAFKGNFNGHGHTIYNLYCDKGNTFHAGLFCALENPCTIDSLVMVNPVLKSRGMMGCIAGYPRGSSSVYVRYCLVINARIEGVNTSGSNNIGGIFGATYPNSGSTYIENCGVTGSITGYYPGGMSGNAERSYITNAYFAGTLYAYGTNYGGMTAHSGNITNGYSYTQVLSSTTQSSASSDGSAVTQAEMQSDSMITLLGPAFKMDNGVNNGYPIMSYMAGVDPVAANLCLGESVTLTAFGYDSYLWDNGATTESITVSPTTTTTYSVSCTSNGVTEVHTSTVTVYPQAVISATVAASSDGVVHGTVSPETSYVACGSTANVSLTVYPDAHWRVASVYVNGAQTYGEFSYGATTITVVPAGTLTDVVVNLTNALTCTHANNLTVSNVYGTNATLSWTAHNTGELSEYHIVVHEVATGMETEYTTTDLSYLLTGLTENTAYQVGVYTFCTDGYGSDTVYVNFTTPCVAPLSVVNNSYPTSTYTTEGNHFPMSNHYLNSFTEQIYLPGDFNNVSAEFSGMSFQYNDGQVITRTLDIYMAHTADNELVQNVWATPLDSYVHVYSGPVTFNNTGTNRWVDIAFDTNFYYNGSDNLLLVVNDITGSEVNNSNAKFYTINTNANRSQCKYTHTVGENWSINNMPTSGTLHTQVNNIRLTACDVVSCIVPNTLVLGPVDASSAELSWYNPNASQNCEIEYKASTDADWTSTGTFSGSSYIVYGLDANTQYQMRVRAVCGNNDFSEWSETVSFRTECEPIITLPYTQNFAGTDVYGSGNDTYVYCWDRYASNPSEPVFINTSSAAHSGGKCLKFYDGSNMTTIAIMPKVDESISVNQLQISYWVRRTQSSNVVFELGVMTDKNDPTTFDVVDTPSLGDWALKEFSFENYTGYGQYIAFRVTQGNGGDYMRLDDITLDYIPVCQHPTNLVVTGTTSEEATIHWTEVGYASDWYVEYGPVGFEQGQGMVETAYDTTYTIYGLNPNTEYDVYVWSDCGVGFVSTAISATFRTDCGPIAQLPYTEDFESGIYSTSQENYIICWDRFASDPAHYVYVPSNSYAHSGTHFLDFHHTTNCYNIAIAPELDQSFDITQLMVNFWACRTGSSGTLEVGVMSDPEADSTFVPVDTIDLSAMNTYAYAEQYVKFDNYQGTGKYIAFRVSYASSCGFYIDDVLIDYAPSCSPVSNVEVSEITGTTAMITWTPGYFGTVDSYTLEYSEAGLENWTSVGSISGNSYLLSGLDFSTDYDLRVMSNCDDGSTGEWVTASFVTKCLVGGDFTIGEGTSTFSYLPSYSTYNYSYTQQLFLASEIGSPKSIESVTFEKVAGNVDRTLKIYLMHTSATSSSSWIDATNATLVFDTVQTLQNGLNTFNFSQPFEYNGTDNLLLIVADMTGSWTSGNTWRTHTAPFTASRYAYQDAAAYSTSSTPSTGTSTTSRNNVIFGSPCDNSGCVAPVLSVSDITSDGATVNWVPGYQESAWEMEYRPLSDTNWVSMGTVYSMSEIITGLMPNTAYKVRMHSDCGGGEYSFWTEVTFTTACGAFTVTETTPWTEDFETNTTMACFETPVTYTNSSGSTYPKMLLNYGVAAHSGGNSLEFKGTTNMLVLPEFTNDIHDLRMSFWATSWGVTTTAVVGVITDLADTTTFEVLGDAGTPGPRGSSNSTGNGNFMGPFDFNNVQATSGRIAILFSGVTSSDAGWNLDDFTVEIIPTCAAPSHTSVTVDNVNENSAEISFIDEDASHTTWIIYYGEAGTTMDTWNSVNVNATTGNVLSGLNANTTYEVYVKTLCSGYEGEDQTNTVTFTTTTLPAMLPYTTDFEDATDNQQWVLLNGTQTNQWYLGVPTDSTSDVNTTLYGTNGLYVSNNAGVSNTYSSTTSKVYAYRDILVPDGTTDLVLSFDWKAQGSNANYHFLRVYWLDPSEVTLTAGNNPPSVNGVNYDAAGQPGNYGPDHTEHWLSLHNSWQHEEMVISADQFTGMGTGDRVYRLAFHWRNEIYSVSNPPAAVDNIELRAITCATPTGLSVSNVDQNSATVSWTGNADSYGVTIVSVNGTDYQTTTTNTLQLTGLTSNTTYQVTVRGYCGADSSILSQPLTFTTACGAITIDATTPWVESFEGYTNSELVCWATPVTHTASNGNVYPRAYLNYGEAAHSGTNTVEFKGATNMLALPEFTNDIHDLRLSFWSTHWGVTTTVAVGVITDLSDPTSFELLCDAGTPGNRGSAAGGNGNYMGPFDFNGVQATSGRIALLFTGTTASDAGWNLDDFTVELIPACAAPAYNSVTVTNVTENSAEVSFTDNNPAHNAWAIYYGAAGTPTSTWNSVNVTSTTGNVISGLNASTNYGVYVVTLCSGVPGDDQTNVVTFATACGPISVATMPWSTGFEGTDEQILNCWVSASTGYRNGHTYPHIEGTASIAHSGSSALEVAFGDIVTALPLFVEDLSQLQVSFWAYNNHWSSQNAVLELGYITNPYDSSTFVSLQSLTDQSYTQTTRTFADLAGLNLPTTTRIAFRFIRPNGTSDLTSWYIDDIEVSMASAPMPCDAPTNLVVSGITQTSAVATWTAGGSETAWNVQYKTASATNWTSATVNTTSFTMSGLTPNTPYQVRVQADCGNGSTSLWTEAVSFTTLNSDADPCDVPTGLHTTDVQNESVSIAWDANPNVNSWNVQYRLANGSWNSATSTTNSYTITGLTGDKDYEIQVQAVCANGTSDWSASITAHTTNVGIESWLENSVTLFPNPAKEFVNVQCTMNNVQSVEVFDVFGKLITTTNDIDNPTRINVSGLADGMYFVRVTTEEGTVTKTFVKK